MNSSSRAAARFTSDLRVHRARARRDDAIEQKVRTDKLQPVIDAALFVLRTLMQDAARATPSLAGSGVAAQELNGHCPRRLNLAHQRFVCTR
jgi:hypothetical protein